MLTFQSISRLVVLPHSVFALPFAIAALLIARARGAAAEHPYSFPVLLALMIGAVVAARTAAMAFNRVADAAIDRENPRTAGRDIPAGRISQREGMMLVVAAAGAFLLCSWLLGWHCLVLAPFVLLWLLGYSFTKRFTPYAHFVLGVSLALAPGGAWWVLRPSFEATPLLLMAAVLLWVTGFDIIYSCQDVASDREQGIFSIPAQLGIDRSLRLARLLHCGAFVAFVLVGLTPELTVGYFAGVVVLAALLYRQHRLVRFDDLSRVNQAFFTTNGILSLFFLLLVLATVR